jgi:uncharacterized DUF497 family protein
MGFEWDDAKFDSNIQKHRISFADAIRVFADPARLIVDETKPEHGEQRYKAIGWVDGRIIAVVFTVRDDSLRIISARRSSRSERRDYNSEGPTAR